MVSNKSKVSIDVGLREKTNVALTSSINIFNYNYYFNFHCYMLYYYVERYCILNKSVL